MKKCSHCHEIKSFDFFHSDKTSPTGYSSYCKPCKKEKDKLIQKSRTYNKDSKEQWRKTFPERKNAHSKVFRALKSGKIFKQPCFVCGSAAEAHHPDYSRPLDVVWLCPPHHCQAHLSI